MNRPAVDLTEAAEPVVPVRPGRSKASKLGKIRRAAIETLIIVLVSLCSCEAALRIYDHYFPNFIFASDDYNKFRGHPFAEIYGTRLNSKGFHGPEFAVSKPPGTYRIIAIGDSYAFGMVPYPDVYLTLLERRLRDSGKPVELINMGVPAIGPPDYLGMLIREGLELKPDMVLLGFFIGNDFLDSRRAPSRFTSFSYVTTLFKFLFRIHRQYAGAMFSSKYDESEASFTPEAYHRLGMIRSYVFRKDDPNYLSDFKKAIRYLVQIRDVCARNKIRLVVVELPDEMQVSPDFQREIVRTGGCDPCDFRQPNEMLGRELRRNGIDVLDLTNDFIEAGKTRRLYRLRDTHWNIAGNALAAERIDRYLESNWQ